MNATVSTRLSLFLFFLLLLQASFARIQPKQFECETDGLLDLGITHTLSHDVVSTGDALILIIYLLNHDQQAAQDIQILLDLPEAAYIESFSPERGNFVRSKGIWSVQHLAGAEGVSLQLSLLNMSQVDLTFSASIEMAIPKADPIEQNNVTQGIIRVRDKDCMVVYNDFTLSDRDSSFLYIDCVKEFPNNVLNIYDRWGNLVFEQERYDNTWNGRRHPRYTKFGWDELPKGTYYYILSFPQAERTDQTGWIYLSE